MSNKNAFTLIELLVVIAIIALLMSILAPALTKVKAQAQDALCKHNLHEWGLMFNMYADDNDGTLMDMNVINGVEFYHAWVPLMRRYYQDFEICLCPATTDRWSNLEYYSDPLTAWDFQILDDPLVADEVVDQPYYKIGNTWAYGSYGKNAFVSSADLVKLNSDEEYSLYYHTVRVRRTSEIPLFGDCNYTGGFPDPHDEPAELRYHGPIDGPNINRWNLDRHNLSINMLFLDWTVKKIGIKQLWMLRWNKDPDWGNPDIVPWPYDPEEWPKWMQGALNYGL